MHTWMCFGGGFYSELRKQKQIKILSNRVGRIGESLKQICNKHEIKLNVDSSDRIIVCHKNSLRFCYTIKQMYSQKEHTV